MKEVINPVINDDLVDEDTIYLINPSGSFVVGGSFGDSGTTGRKIVCDTYGGMGRIGGGCFSSKDPSKVDRSAAYYCRYVAKNIVAAGLASKCEVQVAYAIGKVKPVSIMVDTFGTGTKSDAEILDIIKENITPKVVAASKELMKAKIDRMIKRGIRPRAIRAMVVGVPNVGKSTFINRIAKKKLQ